MPVRRPSFLARARLSAVAESCLETGMTDPELGRRKERKRAIDWPAVRAAYENETTPVTALAKRFGVSVRSIGRRVKQGDWKKDHRKRRAGPCKAVDGIRRSADTALKPFEGDAMATIEAIVEQEAALAHAALSRSAKTDAALSDADRERRARTLNTLLRTYDRIREMKQQVLEETKQRLKTAAAEDETERLDPNDIRQEIKRRLDRILAAARKGRVAGKSGAG
ncbi:MAG: hypothetical protein AAGC95_07640 [Pseudomonadota bacterium]